MKILAFDSSSVTASAAVSENGAITAEKFIDTGLKHSETLMILIDGVLKEAGLAVRELDLIAPVTGPGSFTGVRIGVSAAKGLAQPFDIKCMGISSLEAIAYPLRNEDCIAVPVMDARCSQVYCALFGCGNKSGKSERLMEDSALHLDELAELLNKYGKKKVLAGCGSKIAYEHLENNSQLSTLNSQPQNAVNAAMLAYEKYMAGTPAVSCFDLLPVYLRPSQAERLREGLGNRG
ncbi:MAG: tRNA (adenosine(37)-N6)-threonylcarbamoyltransferase complex dimerization subunit type 1 TsaB [Oscillospiraceae bacterium]|nr:tRNA (adenosine(37)-N6)-threonylcarbamoyltransferase complex dimerization subunit type 1 TsaB [Oscillospiraceae bacterium]